METQPFRRGQVLFWAAATEGGLAVLAVPLGWILGFPPQESLYWDPFALAWSAAITVPMLLAFFAAMRWPVGPLAPIKLSVDRIVKPLFAPCTIADLALIAGLAGIGEELLFRGVLQPFLIDRLGLWPGLALAAACFGLVHPITPAYAVMAAAVGLYLGLFAYWQANTLAVILAHALYDFVALVYLVRH